MPIIPHVIKRFRGIRSWLTRTQLAPDFAESCMNVIVSESGGLEKFRAPQAFTVPIINVGPAIINPFIDFQQASGGGRRHIIGVAGTKIIRWDETLTPLIIDNTPANAAAIFDGQLLNNILFLTNGQRNIKWVVKPDGTGVVQNTGIAAPTVAPTIVVLGGIVDTLANSGAVRAASIVTIKFTLNHNISAALLAAFPALQITIVGVSVGANDFNGTFTITGVPTANTLTYAQVGANETQGSGTGGIANGVTFTQGGRQIRYSYGNSVTGHESSMSPASLITGNIAVATGIGVTIPPSPDPQCDIVWVYGTQDGGGDYFLENAGAVAVTLVESPGNTLYIDTISDNNLQLNMRGSLINNPPPVAPVGINAYTTKWGGRMFLAIGQSVYYTGYEQIRRGRPEECYPPFNHLLLQTGADQLRGIGVIQAGVVAWSRSNEMFMFKGIVEDITTDQPIVFTSFLEQLPWNEGLLSHYTVVSSPYGVIYLASDHNFKVFDGSNKPVELAIGIYPILRQITQGSEERCRAVYWNWCERDWYVCILPIGGVAQPNTIIFIDMKANDNFGIFLAQFNCDSIGIVEDQSSNRRLIISRDGQLYEVTSARATATGGIDLNPPASTSTLLSAFWRGGYYGNDTPERFTTFRYGRVVTDLAENSGFAVEVRTSDDVAYTMQRPRTTTPVLQPDGKFAINVSARRCQVEVRFPDADMSCNVLELQMVSIPGGVR